MKLNAEHIAIKTLHKMLAEQGEPAAAGASAVETDNADSDATDSPFTPAEKRFLGKFDAYGSNHLGIIYSVSDIGIREFMARSGKEFNVTPEILIKLLRDKIIKLVPYTGFGRNNDYTIELQLTLDDVKGLGDVDKEKAETGSSASGAPAGGGAMGAMPETPPPAPEVAWVVKYGDILKESVVVAKTILTEKKSISSTIYAKQSRMLKSLPRDFIKHLEQVISKISRKKYTKSEKQRLIADILDNLSINLELDPKQIGKSYEMFKKQGKLNKLLDEK
jgi:hypothetical protein